MLAKEKPESCCVILTVSVLQGPVQLLLLQRCVSVFQNLNYALEWVDVLL